MKKLILILTALLTAACSPKEEKSEKYDDTIILQDNQGDTLKVYHNVQIIYRTETGFWFKDQENNKTHVQGGIITAICP